jgi:proline dehydrogenase
MGAAILEKLQKLPEPMQQKALQYIESLLAEHEQAEKGAIETPQKKRQAGTMKGTFVLPLADDFDASLDDFQEYME